MCLQCFDTVGWAPACKNWVMRCKCGYLSGTRCRVFAYGSADANAIPKPSLASFKSRLVLPFWYWVTQAVLEKWLLNGCHCSTTRRQMPVRWLAATGCVIAPYYYYYYYLTQALSSQGMKKITLCNKKVQKSSWNEPYSSSSFTKQSCSKMALYRWIRTESRWNKKLISLSSPDWSASHHWPSLERTRRTDWTQWFNGNWLKNVMSLDTWIFRSLTSGCLFCCWTSFTGSCCSVGFL